MVFKVANKVETFGNLTFSATRRDNKTHWNQMNQFCTNSPIKNPQPTSYNRNRGHISQIFPFLVIWKNCIFGEKTQKSTFSYWYIYIHIYIYQVRMRISSKFFGIQNEYSGSMTYVNVRRIDAFLWNVHCFRAHPYF